MKASSFFTKEQQEQILASIKEAEKETSGEIRVHIETSFRGEILDRAAWIFRKLGMHKTAQRNGVLFYLAVKDRRFAIIGDAGLHAKVPEGFWDSVSDLLQKYFKEGKFTEGLSEGILLAVWIDCFGHGHRIVPETEIINTVRAFRDSKKRFPVIPFNTGGKKVFTIKFHCTCIKRSMNANPFHEVGICPGIQIVLPG
jgi:hypothetical protein